MKGYIDSMTLSNKAGLPLWKAKEAIREANKKVKAQGGIITQGKAPKKVLEQILFIDLSEPETETN